MIYFVLIIIAVFIWWYIIIYNKIIKYKNYVENAHKLIDVNLQKRADLIPNLVEVVKTYKNFEKNLLNELTKLRSCVKEENNINKQRQEEEKQIWKDLQEVFAVAEDYPDLKSSENFIELQKEISRIEENLASAREIYNSNLKILNTTVQSFPYNIVASNMNLPDYTYFEANVESNLEIDFNTKNPSWK